jgi:signal transduction histidine kinase
MFLSVLKTARLRKIINTSGNTVRWKWLGRLMIIFFVGYLATILLIVLGYPELLLLITGLVFLLGSVFVYLVVYSAKDDIQNIHKSNEQLQIKNIELRKINLELDQFAYRTSHDLKAPVSSMKGLIKVAELSSSREEIAHCHSLMKDRLAHLEELIRDILDLSKNARTEVDYRSIDVHEVVQQLVRTHISEHDGRVDLQVEGKAGFHAYTDPTRFKMVIGNLLSNALHYADLSKPKPFIKVKFWDDQYFFFISIKDNGVGIDEKYQEKIFDMFFRVAETSIGSGLGLYIVKETTEKMNGRIEVISKPGVGSEFIVKFPLQKEAGSGNKS